MIKYDMVGDIPVRNGLNLAAHAEASGWKWVAGGWRDNGDNPFATVIVGNPIDGEQFKVVWHTRDTGTYRLFSKLHQRATGMTWREAPSLAAIRERIRSRATVEYAHAEAIAEDKVRDSVRSHFPVVTEFNRKCRTE